MGLICRAAQLEPIAGESAIRWRYNYIKLSWTEPFKNLLKNDVKLVGSTINLTEDLDFNNLDIPYEKKNIIHMYNHKCSQLI